MLAEATTTAQTTRSEVLQALRQASAETGSDFDYLLGTAMRESSLKPGAKSSHSSAAGLFQFVQQTWLGMIKQYGAKYGLGSYANAIQRTSSGYYRVDSSADKQAILALRSDPKVSALMAGEYANQTRSQLETRLGRDVCGGELYAAHFLGAGAACRLIELNQNNPSANAAACFPTAATANRAVFYHSNGSPKTVREVYDWTLKQPQVPQKILAAANAPVHVPVPTPSPLDTPQAPQPTATESFFAQTAHSDDLSTLGLFRTASPAGVGSSAATQALSAAATLPQAPFVLTPGVVNLLASLTPGGSHDETAAHGRKIS